MRFVKTHFFTFVALLLVSSGYYTMSLFSDLEESLESLFTAAVLDYEIAGEPLGGLLCDNIDEANTILYAGNIGQCDFAYNVTVQNFIGSFCNALEAEVTVAGEQLYLGPVTNLHIASHELPSGETDELLLELRLLPNATSSGSCAFETLSVAAQDPLSITGFRDTEVVSHFVSGSATGMGAGCEPPEPTVNLYLNKAISGDPQGFELSDFFYHITGNGYDIIAPHDSYTLLPAGIYTIEELVPEGFVKEDWRIGWYGQCERGDTFITTIEIEERHLDWGTLYCEADNQYRPEHGDNEEEAESNSSAGGSARSHNRGSRGSNPRGTTGDSSVEATSTASVTATSSETTSEEDEPVTESATTTEVTTAVVEDDTETESEEESETEPEEETTEEETEAESTEGEIIPEEEEGEEDDEEAVEETPTEA